MALIRKQPSILCNLVLILPIVSASNNYLKDSFSLTESALFTSFVCWSPFPDVTVLVIDLTVLWNSDVRPGSAVICCRIQIADIVFVAWCFVGTVHT